MEVLLPDASLPQSSVPAVVLSSSAWDYSSLPSQLQHSQLLSSALALHTQSSTEPTVSPGWIVISGGLQRLGLGFQF